MSPSARRLRPAACAAAALLFPAAAHAGGPWDGVQWGPNPDKPVFEGHLMARAGMGLAHDLSPGAEHPWDGDISMRNVRPMGIFQTPDHRMRAMVQTEFIGGVRLLDARVDLAMGKSSTWTLGQHIVPFTRAWIAPLPLMQMPERSVNNTLFAPGRRVGATLTSALAGGKVQTIVGAYGEPIEAPGIHPPTVIARAAVTPMGKTGPGELGSLGKKAAGKPGLTLAAGLMQQPIAQADDTTLPRTVVAADVAFEAGGFTAYAEVMNAWLDGATSWGASALVGQMLGERLRASVRANMLADEAVAVAPMPWAAPVTAEPGLSVYLHDSHAMIIARAVVGMGGEVDPAVTGAHLVTQLRF